MKIKKHQVISGKWFKSSGWEGCCDCGLIHKVDYRLNKGVLEVRATRVKEYIEEMSDEYIENPLPALKKLK